MALLGISIIPKKNRKVNLLSKIRYKPRSPNGLSLDFQSALINLEMPTDNGNIKPVANNIITVPRTVFLYN
jgi:hypothetical protein